MARLLGLQVGHCLEAGFAEQRPQEAVTKSAAREVAVGFAAKPGSAEQAETAELGLGA